MCLKYTPGKSQNHRKQAFYMFLKKGITYNSLDKFYSSNEYE
jgi:hypothetical protein